MTLHSLDAGTETLLRWYFGAGQSITGHSPSGAMLDRARTYDHTDTKRDQLIAHGMKRQSEKRELDESHDSRSCVMSFKGEPQYTAIPTAEVRPAPSNDANEGALRRFAKASTGLSRLARVHPIGVEVLSARYGESSADWQARGFPLGGLYSMVDSGKALMAKVLAEKSNRGGGGLKTSQAELVQYDFSRVV